MHRAHPSKRWPLAVIITGALALVAGVLLASGPATADTGLSQLEQAQAQLANCKLLAANATSSGQHSRALNCVADQTRIIALLAPTPSPSGSPSTGPTPPPSPSTGPTATPTATPSQTATASPTSTSTSSSPPPSPTPTPSPTLSGPCSSSDHGAAGGPDGMGSCWPGPDSTGVPAGYPLIVHAATNVTVAGTVIDGWDVQGYLKISAANVTVTNTRIRCSDGDCLHAYASGLNVSRVDIGPDSGLVDAIGLMDGGGTGAVASRNVYRGLNIHGTSDGIRCDGGFSVLDSWVHGLSLGGHSDGCQAAPGANGGMLFRHNVVEGGNTSCFLLQLTGGGVEIRDSLLLGVHAAGVQTSYALNVDGNTVVPGGVSFHGNVLNRDFQVGPFATNSYVFTPATWYGNTYTDGSVIGVP